jgi:CRP/FNR family transcriptional regulator
MSPGTLAALGAAAKLLSLDDGQIIAIEGDLAPPVGFVVSGCVKVYRTNVEGREQTMCRLSAGAPFYLTPAFDDDRRAPGSTQSVGATVVIVVAQDRFRSLSIEWPELALAMLTELSRRMRQMVGLTCDLGLLSVRGRLASFLLTQVHRGEGPPIRWTHETIASNIGTVREVVSRNLRGFVRDGFIRLDRHRIEVIDPNGLEKATVC